MSLPPATSEEVARVYVVDPLPVAREGYAAIVRADPGLRLVGASGSLERATGDLTVNPAEVVILDTRLPRTAWTGACARVHRACPRAALLLVVAGVDGRTVESCRSAGARGAILRSASAEQIRCAVNAIASGRTYFDRAAVAKPGEARTALPFGLTAQQARVLELLTQGLTNREIGVALGISEHTVKSHLTHVTRKLAARDRAHAAVIALREGLV